MRYSYTDNADSGSSTVYSAFTINFDYECRTATLTLDNSCRGDQSNTFGTSTSVCSVIDTHSAPNCPLSFTFTVAPDASSAYGAFTGTIASYVGSVDAATGAFTIDTTAITPSDQLSL